MQTHGEQDICRDPRLLGPWQIELDEQLDVLGMVQDGQILLVFPYGQKLCDEKREQTGKGGEKPTQIPGLKA